MVGSTGHESTVSPADSGRNTGAPETSFRSTGTDGGITHSPPPESRSRAKVRKAQVREFGISPPSDRYPDDLPHGRATMAWAILAVGVDQAVDQLAADPGDNRSVTSWCGSDSARPGSEGGTSPAGPDAPSRDRERSKGDSRSRRGRSLPRGNSRLPGSNAPYPRTRNPWGSTRTCGWGKPYLRATPRLPQVAPGVALNLPIWLCNWPGGDSAPNS